MKISHGSVVNFDCIIKNMADQSILESSSNGEDAYLHGHGMALEAIEKALENKEAGFSVQMTLSPEQAFGEHDDQLVFQVPMSEFDDQELAIGMEFIDDDTDDENGSVLAWRVVDIQDDMVTLDANHPYAGLTLNFDIKVIKVREATPEEIEHGHVHGEGGVHH
jgi:FKBP-type peptidyl-prolyl cis-trans isomerase SlyD